jgi:hypothetical protein
MTRTSGNYLLVLIQDKRKWIRIGLIFEIETIFFPKNLNIDSSFHLCAKLEPKPIYFKSIFQN